MKRQPIRCDLALPNLRTVALPQQRSHYAAVANWLRRYRPPAGGSNRELVRGHLEAFHHLCQAYDWGRASQILTAQMDTPIGGELHNQLFQWGYYPEQIQLYGALLHRGAAASGRCGPRCSLLHRLG